VGSYNKIFAIGAMGRLVSFGIYDQNLYDRDVKELALNPTNRGPPVKIAEGASPKLDVRKDHLLIHKMMTWIIEELIPEADKKRKREEAAEKENERRDEEEEKAREEKKAVLEAKRLKRKSTGSLSGKPSGTTV